jgi:peptidoglycan/LPS O-acetylase OafA/YrhL
MGKISYSMYLFHFYVLHMLNVGLHALDGRTHGFIRQHFYGHLIGFVLYFLILLGLSAAFCTLTWRFIEEPFVRLGRRVIEKRERRFGKGTEIALVPAAGELLSSSNTPDNQL